MSLLSIGRKHAERVIAIDPHTISDGIYSPFENNFYGASTISDEPAITWPGNGAVVRIAKNNDRLTIPERDGDDTPNQMTNTYYMISPHDVIIPQKLVFSYGEKKFRTKTPEPVRHNDAVAYYRTQLDEVTEYD